jgi:hypothetical protein
MGDTVCSRTLRRLDIQGFETVKERELPEQGSDRRMSPPSDAALPGERRTSTG